MTETADHFPPARRAGAKSSRRRAQSAPPQRGWRDALPRRGSEALRATFAIMAALIELAVAIWTAIAVEALYHVFAYGWDGLSAPNLLLCFIVALLFVVGAALRNEYTLANYLDLRGHGWRVFSLWNVAFLCSVALGFFAKSIEESSRVGFLLFYVVGFVAIFAARVAVSRFARAGAASGGLTLRRIFLVGFEQDIEKFVGRYHQATSGAAIVGALSLRDESGTLGDDLALAAATARILRPDDVFILAPWSRTEVIDRCATAFLRVPAQLHLGPERVLDRFANARIARVGAISSLSLGGGTLNLGEAAAKRAFDIVVASTALALLSPLLLAVAALIRLDSPGPALFLQRRYGFNQEPFRIVKFRTMTTMDDGRAVPQATRGDARITRIGRFLRKWNIDELPQLFNVLRGEMSIVGPRPHALVHDQLFERRIALYARRHNVKPGITGWAQVNGLRGEIDSPEKIRARVEHDLYYIDNCSIGFDVWICLLTLFSRKAYENAM